MLLKEYQLLGNQLTKDKLIEINPKEPLRYEPIEETPLEELEVIEEINVIVPDKKDKTLLLPLKILLII